MNGNLPITSCPERKILMYGKTIFIRQPVKQSQGIESEEEHEVDAMKFMHDVGQSLNIDVGVDLANYRAKQVADHLYESMSPKWTRLTTDRAAKIAFMSYYWNLLHKYKDDDNNDDEEPLSTPRQLSKSVG
ncbi:hypothetical protein evm_002570 [Chilo suppressalis]|nr:hypothetical protein evm_002570 [Chilo suppressalis]